jgi:uncharacterized protein
MDHLGYVHFDSSSSKNNRIDVLVVKEKCSSLLRNKFIKISDKLSDKTYIGRVIEGPFFQPEEVTRDSALAQVSILYGQEFPAPPNFYGMFRVELIGELDGTQISNSGTRPRPQAAVIGLNDEEINTVLGLSEGDLMMGHLGGYPKIQIRFDSKKISIIPRNVGIFGTVGSGKTNSAQVLIEELAAQKWAVLVLDVEGEYTQMDKPNPVEHEVKKLKEMGIRCEGIKDFHVLKLCNQESATEKAQDITIKIDQIDPYVLAEILDTTEPQTAALMAIIEILKGDAGKGKEEKQDEDDILTPGRKYRSLYTLSELIEKIDEHRADPSHLGVSRGSLQPLRRKLETLRRTRAFDSPTAATLDPEKLLKPGRVTIFDLSFTGDYEKNLLIAELLRKVFAAKKYNKDYPRTMIMIEEAHSFISRDNQDRMYETLRMLKEIARRGRKRWLALSFISQQPSHLPNEIFELSNTRIVHNIRSVKNLEVLRNSSGDVSEEMWEAVPNLGVGESIINGPQFRNSLVAKMRHCSTKRVRQEDIS